MRPSPGPSEIEAARVADATIAAAGAIATAQLTFAKVVSQADADCADQKAAADAKEQKAEAKAEADAATAIAKAEVQKLIADATAELVCAAQIENATTHAGERKRCQPPNLGELGDLLAADAIAAQADASQAEPAPLVRRDGRGGRPCGGHGGGHGGGQGGGDSCCQARAGLLRPASLEARAASVASR